MRRSTRARRSSGNARSKRVLAVVGTLAVFGGIVAVTQISSAQQLLDRSPGERLAKHELKTARAQRTAFVTNDSEDADLRFQCIDEELFFVRLHGGSPEGRPRPVRRPPERTGRTR